jgi:Tfp pilus assembly protein PilF
VKKQERTASGNTVLHPRRLVEEAGHSPGAVVAVAVLLAAVTVAAYWGVTSNDFIYFDDAEYIVENEHIRDGLSWDAVKWAFTATYAGNWHPLTWLSHAMDIELFGLEPAGHHIVNLALHTLSTLLLFGFLRHTTGRLWASAMVAGLFALHPLHVESVAWAAERKDVLSTFFWMCTMWAWVFYAKRPGLWKYIAVMALYGLGLMAKPMLVTLPVMLLLLDYWPLDRFEFDYGWLRKVRTLAMEKAPLLAMAIGSALVTLVAQEEAIVTINTMDMATRVTNIFVSYGRYIWQMVWPTGLALLYPRPNEPMYGAAAAATVFLLVVTAFAVVTVKRRKYFIVGWLWYLLTLVPVIGIVHVGMQSHADRYTYIPLIGIFIVIVWWAADICIRYPRIRPVFASLAVLVLATLGIWTWRTTAYWKNDVSIFERTTATTKNNIMMMINLGDALLWRGHLDQAQATLEKTIEISPQPDAYVVLAIVQRRKGQIEESVRCYKEALALDPNLVLAHLNVGILLHDLQRFEEAESHLQRAIELDPKRLEAHNALGLVLGATSRLDEGIAECRKAIELDPKQASPHRVLASLLAKQGRYEAAAEEYRLSLAIESDYSAWANLGDAMLELGSFEEAERNLREAIKLKPAEAEAYLSLAKALEGLGRRAEAIEAANKALSLDPNYAEAAAYRRRLTGETP